MQYATIMPRHAIDNLWTADLDVNLFFFCECKHFIQTWCKLKFSFFDTNAFYKDADVKSYDTNACCEDANAIFHDANVPCGDVNGKFIHDNRNATLLVCHDADVPLRICHDANVPLRVCHDANVLLRVCHDANVLLRVCHDANAPLRVWCKCFYSTQMQ